MRLLFVYGFEPSGHASAAQAMEELARARGFETRSVNVSQHHPFLGPAVARLYLSIIQRFPRLWRFVYDNEPIAAIAQDWRKVYLMLNGARLRSTLESLRPDIIVCTHAPPLGALALEKERGHLRCPLIGVITDLRVHTYWIRPGADLYLAPNQEAASSLREHGIAQESIVVSGIPIHPTFAEPIARETARARLGLAGEAPVLFISGGSRGLGRVERMVAALLSELGQVRVLVATGSNAVLLRQLRARYRGDGRVWIYPELDAPRVKELMCAADLLAGKAGGLTIAESLALGLPMLFFEPLPGQEARNAEYLVARGAAEQAEGFADLAARARRLLEPGLLARRRAAASALAHADSASRALDAISALAARR